MWIYVAAPNEYIPLYVNCIRGENGKFILIIKANEMHYFSSLFGKELYPQTDLLSIIRSTNSVFKANGICHNEILKSGKITSVYICTL